MTVFEEAVQYVRENKTWSEAEEAVALEKINHLRCDIQTASEKIASEIHDLMEEWSEENGYPEEWWYYEGDEDDIFFTVSEFSVIE